VRGSRSCAELAIVDHLRADGWHGVWVNAFRGELRSQWFPALAVKTLAEAGAPRWAAGIFGHLRAANGGTLSGFFDVFAWREPGRVGFYEAKVGPDRIKPAQLQFVEVALRFRHLEEFVEVAAPFPRGTPAGGLRSSGDAAERDLQRSIAGRPSSSSQGLLRRAGRDLQALGTVSGPDEKETRQILRDVAVAIRSRR
jgi:hypothetical protein